MGGLVALALNGAGSGGTAPARAAPPTPPPFARTVNFPPGCTPDREKPPRLVVDLPAEGLDFGRVKQGVNIDRVVTFRNAGLGPLCLDAPTTGCGCIHVTIRDDKRRYESGEEGAFLVTLKTEGHWGRQDKTLKVMTNEIERPLHTYMVKAEISLGVVRRSTPAQATVRLTSPADDAPWKVVEVVGGKQPTQDVPAYTWQVTPIDDPKKEKQGFALVVTHPGHAKDEPFGGSVIVRTTHPDRPEITLLTSLAVSLPVKALPGTAIFGFRQNGVPSGPIPITLLPQTDKVTFNVLGHKIEPIAGKPEDPAGVGFVATMERNAKGVLVFNVSYDGKTRRAGQLEATLVISLDLEDQKELRVPLRATIADMKPASAQPPPKPAR
jgi:hypothetical protein